MGELLSRYLNDIEKEMGVILSLLKVEIIQKGTEHIKKHTNIIILSAIFNPPSQIYISVYQLNNLRFVIFSIYVIVIVFGNSITPNGIFQFLII